MLGKAEASAYLQVNSGSVGSYINHGKKNLIKEAVTSVLRDILPTSLQNAFEFIQKITLMASIIRFNFVVVFVNLCPKLIAEIIILKEFCSSSDQLHKNWHLS